MLLLAVTSSTSAGVGVGAAGSTPFRAAAAAVADFQITIDPQAQQLPPGQSVSFVVGIGAIDGFSEPVILSVGDLPEGVSGAFSVNPVAPSGTSFLTLTATSNAPTGVFSFTVTGRAGDITHVATRQVTVDFGLIPQCFGAVEGMVTDADTGLPIEATTGIDWPVQTDANGHYRIEGIPLGQNNSPRQISIGARKEPDYWYVIKYDVIVVCDQTTQVNFTLVPVKLVQVSGRVVEGNPDPNNFEIVIPTSTPIEGAKVEVLDSPPTNPDTTDADGLYEVSFRPGYNNAPRSATVCGRDPTDNCYTGGHVGDWRHGYWPQIISIGTVEAGQHVVVQEIALVKRCTGSISGQAPAGAVVDVTSRSDSIWNDSVVTLETNDSVQVQADAEGRFTVPELVLGRNNRPAEVFVSASLNSNLSTPIASGTTRFESCGEQREVPLTPIGLGAIEGHVYDDETGAPVEGVPLSIGLGCRPCDTTDADGHYRLEGIDLGSLQQVAVDVTVGYGGSSLNFFEVGNYPDQVRYWAEYLSDVEVHASETTTLDVRVLRVHYGHIAGVIRDVITKAPVANVSVWEVLGGGVFLGLGGHPSDAEGRYMVDILPSWHNEPRNATLIASVAQASGYWPKYATGVPVRPDETSPQDFELLPICQGARITGKVVNAVTQEPILNARVTAPGGLEAHTDSNGDYLLEHVNVGVDNTPLEVSLSASALGFLPQSKRVTVFCGAEITIDFGRPDSTAAIEGYVTNLSTSTPIANAFVGSAFGAAAHTDANGYYRLPNAPLNPDGSDRTWQITADPDDFEPQTKPVTVHANTTARLDFGFGASSSGTIIVEKQTDPDGASGNVTFAGDAAGTISDNGQIVVANLAPGTYTSTENNPTLGFDLTSIVCNDGTSSTPSTRNLSTRTATFKLDPGETVKCTFTNTQRGRAKVLKTVSGAPPSGTQSFVFQLRSGASTTQTGTILESGTSNAANGGVINFTTLLVPGTTYALCEQVMPGWMTTLGPPFYVVYNPSGDNSTVCTDFAVTPGETKEFALDNKPPPGGLGRTIGFWKNWASCAKSSGKQKPVLDQTLTLAEPVGVRIGDLVLHSGDCLKAVRILDKSTINTGTKKASDPAFSLAAQLLAAKLNVVAGAGTCPAAVTAINTAHTLLDAINLNGITHATPTTAQKNQLNSLATTLDRYNNNLLC